MKRFSFSKLDIPSLGATAFWERCCRRKLFLAVLCLMLAVGVAVGSLVGVSPFWGGYAVLPLFFSGFPAPEGGALSFFSAYLLNMLIFLSAFFLLGVTAFGFFALPLLLFLKGFSVGLGAFFCFGADEPSGFGRLALSYGPGTALCLLLLLLYGLRSMAFSDCLRKTTFSSGEAPLNFREYWKDYVFFLCLSVAVSLVGALFSLLGSLFF